MAINLKAWAANIINLAFEHHIFAPEGQKVIKEKGEACGPDWHNLALFGFDRR